MSSVLITSFFTKSGIPQTGLTPTVRLWEVANTSHILIIGTPDGVGDPGTGVGTDGVMQELINGVGSPPTGSQDGFYKFVFTSAMGYNEEKSYAVRSDGGVTVSPNARYHTATIDPTGNIIDNKVDSLQLNSAAILAIVTEVLKYDRNRTLIDKNAFTLTVFDIDGTTPLRVFDLKDENGVASITRIFERIPVT